MFVFVRARIKSICLIVMIFLCVYARKLHAQAAPAGIQQVSVSAFALLGDTYTGLGGASNGLGGRNFSLTAGLDIGVLEVHRFELAVEARGTYPLHNGEVDGQKSLLAGVRVGRTFADTRRNAVTPYVDFLAGRGSTRYVNGGYPVPPLLYSYSSGNVFSAGGGLQLRLTPSLSFVAEAQVQRWSTPVTTSRRITAKQANAGIAYRFGVNSKPR